MDPQSDNSTEAKPVNNISEYPKKASGVPRIEIHSEPINIHKLNQSPKSSSPRSPSRFNMVVSETDDTDKSQKPVSIKSRLLSKLSPSTATSELDPVMNKSKPKPSKSPLADFFTARKSMVFGSNIDLEAGEQGSNASPAVHRRSFLGGLGGEINGSTSSLGPVKQRKSFMGMTSMAPQSKTKLDEKAEGAPSPNVHRKSFLGLSSPINGNVVGPSPLTKMEDSIAKPSPSVHRRSFLGLSPGLTASSPKLETGSDASPAPRRSFLMSTTRASSSSTNLEEGKSSIESPAARRRSAFGNNDLQSKSTSGLAEMTKNESITKDQNLTPKLLLPGELVSKTPVKSSPIVHRRSALGLSPGGTRSSPKLETANAVSPGPRRSFLVSTTRASNSNTNLEDGESSIASPAARRTSKFGDDIHSNSTTGLSEMAKNEITHDENPRIFLPGEIASNNSPDLRRKVLSINSNPVPRRISLFGSLPTGIAIPEGDDPTIGNTLGQKINSETSPDVRGKSLLTPQLQKEFSSPAPRRVSLFGSANLGPESTSETPGQHRKSIFGGHLNPAENGSFSSTGHRRSIMALPQFMIPALSISNSQEPGSQEPGVITALANAFANQIGLNNTEKLANSKNNLDEAAKFNSMDLMVNDDGLTPDEVKAMSETQLICYKFFIKPTTPWARLFEVVSTMFIILSSILVMFETLPQFCDKDGKSTLLADFFGLEIGLTLFWIIEFIGRYIASLNKFAFLTDKMTIIDICSLIPILLITSTDENIVTFSRALRILRILKLSHVLHYSPAIAVGFITLVASRALRKSVNAILLLFSFIVFALLLTSTAMYWVEKGEWSADHHRWERADGSRSPFNSIPETFYWSMTTLATCGYGDNTPVTAYGKFIACLTMCLSIFVIALPTSVIGSNFMAEWQLYHQALLQKKMRKDGKKEEYVMKTEKQKNREKIAQLEEKNLIYLQTVGEIQQKLTDINPPNYYADFQDMKIKHQQAKRKIADLEKKIAEREAKKDKEKNKDLDKEGKKEKTKDAIDSPAGSNDNLGENLARPTIAKSWVIGRKDKFKEFDKEGKRDGTESPKESEIENPDDQSNKSSATPKWIEKTLARRK